VTADEIITALIYRRRDRDWTQQRLARQLGVNIETLRRWERRRTSPGADLYHAWITALGLDVELRPARRSGP
jgi:transcriptional regulator with XRE-family HTH domain